MKEKHTQGRLCPCGKWHMGRLDFESEVAMLRHSNESLKESRAKWINAWHEMRLRVGQCYWEIPYRMAKKHGPLVERFTQRA